MPAAVNGLKFCPRCKQVKPVSEFSIDPNPHRRDGLQTYCKGCKVAQNQSLADRRAVLSSPQPPPNGLKCCTDCKETKPISDFNKSSSSRDGLACRCRECAKTRKKAWEQRLKANGTYFGEARKWAVKRYGLSAAQYDALFQAQHGLCALCHKPETATYRGRVRQLVVDHDHETGQLRSLLCSTCNIGIGHLQDSPALCEAAAAYLRRHGK